MFWIRSDFFSVGALTSFSLQLQANAEAYACTFLGPANAGNLQDAAAGRGTGPGNEGEAPAGGDGGHGAPRAAGEGDVNVDE